MDITVYIPTRGRIGLSTQITLREIRDLTRGQITPVLLCPPNEVDQHLRYYPRVLACPADNINKTHEWLLLNANSGHPDLNTRGVVTLDDDMYFSRRVNPNEATPLERVTDLMPMFDWISDRLDNGYAHGGISARQGNNHIPRSTVDCIRVNNAHFFDSSVFQGEEIRLPQAPVMHDFYFSLKLLTLGYPNTVAYHHCWSQRGSGTKGGCSIYRTQELQRTWCETLHREFPDFVKIVTKKALSGGSVFSGERIDVNIQWLKAWEGRDPIPPAKIGYNAAVPNLARK
jgi:hypothetical protein